MSSNKRTLLRILLTANGNCGCGRPKPTDVFEPTPKPKPPSTASHRRNSNPASSLTSSTSTSSHPNGVQSVDGDDGDFTSTTVSEAGTENPRNSTSGYNMMPKQSPLMDSVAVEKESEDPYKDFRHSMLQMIFEKEMYSESDLKELLEAFLELNSPRQHEVIMKAFTEICQEAFPSDKKKKKKKKKMSCAGTGHLKKQPLARA